MKFKIPNKDEQTVINSLRFQGFKDLAFEPDGNIPPDIVLNKNIAIEVRKLNQNFELNGSFEGLEQSEFSIHGMISKIMKSFSFNSETNGAFLVYSFNRPLPPLKELRKEVLKILKRHLIYINQNKHYTIGNNFKLQIFPASKKLANIYMHGISSDSDSGGMAVEMLHENLNFIIKDKESKISKYRSKYAEWWLGLVDNLIYVWDEQIFEQLKIWPKMETYFNRILLVSANTPDRWKYLYE